MSKTKNLFAAIELKKSKKEIKQYLHCIYPSSDLEEVSNQGLIREFITIFHNARLWELSIKDSYEIAISEYQRDSSENKTAFRQTAKYGLCPNF